ncbi:MAG: DUF799 domain-containing protein [Burkholderiales bacterium]|nr:DUF799 domain-containing protein [Burkholderiales bacterium]
MTRATFRLSALLAVLVIGVLSGCATTPPKDYSKFQAARPATILVLPPLNESPDIKASAAVWSHATRPLAEAGYYVLPVTLVDETFKQNGVTTAFDAHGIPVDRLRRFFGADAALYIKIREYGTTYRVIASETAVQVSAQLVDLRDGAVLWEGRARASSAEQQQSQSSLAGMLVAAVVNQIIGTTTDAGYNYAGMANGRLILGPEGVLYGPRSPRAGQPPAPVR